nr:hypothetical protein [Burkholderia gladioli]
MARIRSPAVSISDTVRLVLARDADAQFQNAVGRHMRACAERHAGLAGEARDTDRHVDGLAGLHLRQHRQRRGGGDPLPCHLVGLLDRLLGLRELRTEQVELALLAGEGL